MSSKNTSLLTGDFTIFGFTRNPHFVDRRLQELFGIEPEVFQIGALGQMFFYTTYGDIAESENELVLKLGFLRSRAKSALTAKELLDQKLVGPRSINTDGFSGNGLVMGLSKTEPVFSIFQTLMSVPQLYYYESEDSIICSDVLRILTQLIPNRELNESILPQHYLFRSVYGSDTYFQGVERVIPGQYLKWAEWNTEIRRVRSLDVVSTEAEYIRKDVTALNLLSESLQDVVSDYVKQVEAKNQGLVTLLSGGVDSSLVQYLVNASSTRKPSRSISYAIQVPSFEFEIEYARQASQLLQTEHTFVKYSPEDYPGLLLRAIEILAQPLNLEIEPSMLAIAEYIHSAQWPERFYFTGAGGDTIFGGDSTVKMKGLQTIRNLPFAGPILKGLAAVLPASSKAARVFLKGANILESEDDPDSYYSPMNSALVYISDENLDIIHHWFSDQELRETFANRRELVAQYTKSHHYIDKVYFIDQFTDLTELAAQNHQLFLAHYLEQVSSFYDEDFLKTALTIHPDIRYIKGFKYKYLLKRILAQKTSTAFAYRRKGDSIAHNDLLEWMRSGFLQPLVNDISRPDFLSEVDLKRLKQKPDYLLWSLLNYDLFKKQIIKNTFSGESG